MRIYYSHFYWFLNAYENKYYFQIYLENCDYQIASKQMTDYPDELFFERLDIINAVLQ